MQMIYYPDSAQTKLNFSAGLDYNYDKNGQKVYMRTF